MTRQTKITTVLAVFTAFCMGMEGMRMYRSESPSYIFLIWNLFLAWIPYLLSLQFMKLDIRESRVGAALLLLLWILFLPNGPYIITDLIHLRPRAGAPMWYDVLLISTIAWNGLLLTLLSVGNIHRRLQAHVSPMKLWAALFLLFLSAGYGIYLGRFLRLNSWDAFLNPWALMRYSMMDILHPLHHPESVALTAIVGCLLSLSYAVFYLITYPSKLQHETN